MTILLQLDFEGNTLSNVPGTVTHTGSTTFDNGAIVLTNGTSTKVDTTLTIIPAFTLRYCGNGLAHTGDAANKYMMTILDCGTNGTKLVYDQGNNGLYFYNLWDNTNSVVAEGPFLYYYSDAIRDDVHTVIDLYQGIFRKTYYEYGYWESDYGNIDYYLSYGNYSLIVDGSIGYSLSEEGIPTTTPKLYWWDFRDTSNANQYPQFNLSISSLLSTPDPKFIFWYSDNAAAWGFQHIETGRIIMDFAPFCPNFDYDPTMYVFDDGTIIVGHYGGQAYKIDIHGNVLLRHTPFYAEAHGWEDEYWDQDGIYTSCYGRDTNGNEGTIGYIHLSKNLVQTKVITGLADEVPFPFPGLRDDYTFIPPGAIECHITGNVSKENVGPIEGAKVVWVSDQGYPLQTTTTDASGNYTLYFMSTTPKRILVTHPTLGCLVHGGVPTIT